MSNLASHRILNDCSCNDATSRILIIPLSTAGCIFECEKCHAMQLFNLLESKHLSCLAESISQFDYQPGWSDGKFLVCYGNKLALDGGSELCGNENPEAFRYVKRMPCRYKYCQSCHTCVPISDYDTCTNSGSSSSCNSNAVSSSACPRCGDAMEWNDTQTESTEAAAHVGKPRQVQPVPDELGAIELYEQAELEEACRVCIACGGALPLKRVRSFTRTREHEAQAEEEKAKQSCNMCGGGLKHGRGLSFVKCTLCEATADIEVVRANRFSSIDEDAVECDECKQPAAYRAVAWYAAYAQCTNCGNLVKESNLAEGAVTKTTKTEDGENVACKQCKNSELEYRLIDGGLQITCTRCGGSVKTIKIDDEDATKRQNTKKEGNVGVGGSSAMATSVKEKLARGTLYVKRKVGSVEEIAVGDHIAVARIGGTYEHHMVVEQVEVEKDEVSVIEYSGGPEKVGGNKWQNGTISCNKLVVTQELTLFLCVYQQCDPPMVVLERARSRLDEQKYNLFTNNCEHFAVWCKIGDARSAQVAALLASLATDFERYVGARVDGRQPAAVVAGPPKSIVGNVDKTYLLVDDLVRFTANKIMIRIGGSTRAVQQVVAWAQTTLKTLRLVKAGELSFSNGLQLVVLDLVRRIAATFASMGSIVVERQLAAVLLNVGMAQPVAAAVGMLCGAAVYAACSTAANKVGRLHFDTPQ